MPQFIPHTPTGKPGTSLPLVRLTVRSEAGEQKFEFRQDAILLGSAAPADIILPDAPALLAVATVVNGGLRLRYIHDTQPVTYLRVREELPLGVCSIRLDFLADTPLSAARSSSHRTGDTELQELRRQFEQDRAEWEADAERQAESLAARSRELLEKEKQLQSERQEWEQCRTAQTVTNVAMPADIEELRAELLKLRDSLYQQYRQRRDAVVAMREAVRHAASKVQEEKKILRISTEEHQLAAAALTGMQEQLQTEKNDLARQAKLLEEWQQQLLADQAAQRAEAEKFKNLQREYEQKTRELHDDLVRLQRQQELLGQREAMLQEREQALQNTENYWSNELPRLLGLRTEIENKLQALKSLEENQATEKAALEALKLGLDEKTKHLEQEQQSLAERLQGCTAWERQLGQDRLRLDRLEAELEQRQEVLAYEIKQHEESVQNWNDQRAQSEAEFEKLQREIAEARHVLAERARIEADLAEREANLQEAQAELAHQQQLLDHRLARVNHLRHRLLQRRQVLQGQLQNIIHSETAQESLQEQLRRRTAVLTQREQAQKQLEDTYQTRLDELEKSELAWKSKQAEWLVQQQKEREALDERHRLLDEQALQIQKDQQILTELQQQLLSQKQQIAEERQAAKQEQQAAQARQAELESARRHWEEAMPKFLRSAESALERVITVRSQLRSQLLEIHAYRQRCYEEISNRKSEVQALAHQLEKQQQVLMRLQDEQKLEAAALKQDVLHWQAQLQLLKENWQASQTDISEKEQRLEHRARELEQSQNRLQLQSSELQNRERDIQYRRSEVNKHLADMQGWYRLKLRDMADKKLPHGASDLDTELIDPPHILPLKSTRAGTDEHLADLLNGMGLIDAATLKTLMEEAARQRISLRDCLLQNDFLTSFQLELIETGRMESLVLGPLRIIDRLRTGTMETIYRVFDPRLGDEILLRQLSSSVDQNWKEEYQALFSQAALVQHTNVAGTFDVVTMEGSPAVLQEWLVGLPGSEWQHIVTDASVALKLAVQLASGLSALHQVGLIHGQIHAGRLLLTPAGVLKLCGAGEPRWLAGLSTTTEPTMAEDLAAAIEILLPWCRVRKPSGALTDFIKKLETRQISSAEQLQTAAYAVLRSLPTDEKSWQELLHFVKDRLEAGESSPLKKSA